MKKEALQIYYSANKTDLDLLLKQVLNSQAFCGNVPIDLHRIKELLDALKDNISFVVEFPYTDSHYRDCYYFYHSAKFENLPRETVRVHIFDNCIKNMDSLFIQAKDDDSISKFYYGYFIVRPLNRFPLGHSFISPKAFKKQNFLCCLMEERVYLLGIKLTIFAFPHVAQDTETHTCAESSLWALLTYYGSKYPNYQTLLPSDIIRHLNSISAHRMLPSNGLTVNELATVLTQDGHNCVLYTKNTDGVVLLQIMRIYIESGIPLIVALENKKSGHAIVAIGHEEVKVSAPKNSWKDVCEDNRDIVFIDDNMAPYQLANANEPTKHYEKDFADMKIVSLVVPLQKHMFLEAKQAYNLIKYIFNHAVVGLMNFGNSWNTRLLLTSGRAFKNSLINDSLISQKIKNILLRIRLPKFVWICEIYKDNSLANEKCDGIVLMDSTGGNSLSSVILYILENRLFISDGIDWKQCLSIIKFEKKTYKHNLKGVWSQWKN